MMIHVMRDGQQFGPYTLEDLNAYLLQGTLLPTDQAWWEGAPAWVPMDQVPGVQLPGMPITAAAAPVEGTASAANGSAKKKKIIIITGSVFGVAALASVLFIVLKPGGDDPASDPGQSTGGTGGTTFSEIVKPIFEKSSCYDCHDGADPENKKNKALNLAQNDSIKEDIEAGNADESELIFRLTDKEDPMPPEGKGGMLSQEDVQKIKDWINAGAKF